MITLFFKLTHINHLHWSEMRELFVALSLQAFGLTMIKLFLPIILLVKGIPLEYVALFFIFHGILQALLHPIIIRFIHIIGVKHCLALSFVTSISSFILLALSEGKVHTIIGVLALNALAQALYWDSRHMHSANIIHKKTAGKTISTIVILVLIAAALGPLTGALITDNFGFNATLYVAAIFILSAMIPLFMTKDNYFTMKYRKRSKKTPRRHLIANAAMVFDGGTSESLWPLFLFLLIGNISSLGFIISAGLIITILITTLIGKYTDKGLGGIFIMSASIGRSFTHILRIGVSTTVGALLVNLIGEVTNSLKTTPFSTFYYRHARQYGIAHYVRDMQVVAASSHASYWLLLYIGMQFFEPKLALLMVFVVAALVAPLHMLITSRR